MTSSSELRLGGVSEVKFDCDVWPIICDQRKHASYNVQLVMSLPAMSLCLRFCTSRKGRTGGGGRVPTWAQIAWLRLGLVVENTWLALGGSSLLLLCMNGLRKQSSGHVGPPFLAVKLFSCSYVRGNHWQRAMTIERSVDSGCGLSHKSAQDGCNAICMRLEASKATWNGNVVHLGVP